MPIVRRPQAIATEHEFVVVGVGGAGARFAAEVSNILPPGGDTISVDRSLEDLKGIGQGKRISIGYPLYGVRTGRVADGDAEFVDESDLYRLKAAIGEPKQVFIVGGLGGHATRELFPSVIRTAMVNARSVLAIVTLPFQFEGKTKRDIADDALRRIKNTGCPLAQVDSDQALSSTSQIGNVCGELKAIQARVLMTVLTATGAGSTESMTNASEMLNCLADACDVFVSHGSSDSVKGFRKTTRAAINRPMTSGIELREADRVGVTIAGPVELPMRIVNATMGIVEEALKPDAVLTTSFVAVPEGIGKPEFRISIVAGRGMVDVEERTAPDPVSIGEEITNDLMIAPLFLEPTKNGAADESLAPALF